MKITDKEISEYYEVTTRTITNYKNGTEGKRKLYNAMRAYLESPPQSKAFADMTTEELHKEHEAVVNKMQSDIDCLQIIADFIKERE